MDTEPQTPTQAAPITQETAAPINWDAADTISTGINLFTPEERDTTINTLIDSGTRPLATIDPITNRSNYSNTDYCTKEQKRLMESGGYTLATHRQLCLQYVIAHAKDPEISGRSKESITAHLRAIYGFHGEEALFAGGDTGVDPTESVKAMWENIGAEAHALINTDYVKTASGALSQNASRHLSLPAYRQLRRDQDREILKLQRQLSDLGDPKTLTDQELEQYLELKDKIYIQEKINSEARDRIHTELTLRAAQAIREHESSTLGQQQDPAEKYITRCDIANNIYQKEFEEVSRTILADTDAEKKFEQQRAARDRAFFALQRERDSDNLTKKALNQHLRQQGETLKQKQETDAAIQKNIDAREKNLLIEENIPEETKRAQAARQEAINLQNQSIKTQAAINARQQNPEAYQQLAAQEEQLKQLKAQQKPYRDPTPYREGKTRSIITGACVRPDYNSGVYAKEMLYLMPRAEYQKLTKDLGVKEGSPIYARISANNTYKVIPADNIPIPCLNKKAFAHHYRSSLKKRQKPTKETWQARVSGSPINVIFTTTQH